MQAKQREIQAYLQQLGSIESQMVSAAQMIQEAVASIREVCPDELENYQATINALFGGSPIAQLTASVDPQTENETPSTPVEPEDSQVIDVVSTVETSEPDATALIEEIKCLSAEMSWNDYRKFVNSYPLPQRIVKKSKDEVRAIFEQFLGNCQTEALRGMIAKLRKA